MTYPRTLGLHAPRAWTATTSGDRLHLVNASAGD
jgi:hypothetical protein